MPQNTTAPSANGAPAAAAAGNTPPPAAPPDKPNATVAPRKEQFMIAPSPAADLRAAGLSPISLNMALVEQTLKDNPDVEYLKTVTPKGLGLLSTLGAGNGPQSIVVAKMDPDHAAALRQGGGGQLTVERDHLLTYTQPAVAPPTDAPRLALLNVGVMPPSGAPMTLTITVQADGTGAPVPSEVYIFGSMLPVQGVTDANGQVTVTLYGETPQSLRGVYVNPIADHWGHWLPQPALDSAVNNVIPVRPISQFFAGFPGTEVVGWGQQAMNMDKLDSSFQGQGVRIGIIDSGAAAQTHADLRALFHGGADVSVNPPDPNTWANDTVGHGSHCSGIIAGLRDGRGIRGFAPAAELYAFKIFPGGSFSDLIAALDDCINQQVDVVNLSLGSDQPSALLTQKIQKAHDLGVACIVAAGNSGGPVQFPASLPTVLAVSAIGKAGEYPADSFHGTQMAPPGVGAAGYFSASFTCFGPQVGVCAPGVAILSSVPPNNYAVWDGTSMATPHVTGLAALLLAHHPDFQPGGPYAARDGRRVDRLYTILRLSGQPVGLTDPNRTGAGLPDALRAFSITAANTPGVFQPQSVSAFQSVFQPQIGSFLPFSATPQAPPMGQPQAAQGQPQVLPQSFWDDLGSAISTIGQAANTVGQVASTAGQVGHAFGLFNAAPQAPPTAPPQADPAQPGQTPLAAPAGAVLPQTFRDELARVMQGAVSLAIQQMQAQRAANIGYAAAPQATEQPVSPSILSQLGGR